MVKDGVQRALRCLYWLATAGWLAGFGGLLGTLMRVHPPDTDRAPLALLLSGTVLFTLAQWLGEPRPFKAFARTLLLGAAYVLPLLVAGGSRVSMLTPPIVAGYLLLCAGVAALSPALHVLTRRLIGRPAPVRASRLTDSPAFALHTLASGMVMLAVTACFLWRAQVERPDFLPILYPNPYSQSMEYWTRGILLLSGTLAGLVIFHAARIRSDRSTHNPRL